MNTYKYKLLALAVVSALGLAACGSDDDPEVVVPPPPPPPVVVAPTTPAPLAFVVTGGITNASTGNVITFANTTAGTVTLSFKEGDAASANVVNLNGTAITSLTTIDGNFAFRLKSGATPTNFSVVVSAPGYLTKSYILDLSDTSQPISTTFELVAANAAGVVAATQTTAVTAGTVAAAVEVAATQSGTSAGVTIPAGTVLQNAAGAPVSGTQVNLNIATAAKTAAADSVTLAQIIPQGLNEATDNLVRVPLAGASVTMTDNQGNKIKKFSTPISLSLSIPAGDDVAEGDVVSISSYDEDTGVWTRDEFSATVGALDTTTNSHTVSFQTDHLTFYGPTRTEPACGVDMSYTVTGFTVPASGLDISLETDELILQTAIPAGRTSGILLSAGSMSRMGFYAGASARVLVTKRNDRSVVWYDSVNEVPVCGNFVIGGTNPEPTPVSENFNVNLVCTNDTTVTKALTGALVSYGLAGKAKVKATDNNNGSYSLVDLVQGSTYEVKVEPVGVAGAATTNFTVTANGAAETGTINLACQTATGAG